MENSPLRYLRMIAGLVGAGFVMLVGAIAGFAAHAPAVGITFMILMLGFGTSGCAAAWIFTRRARKWRDRQELAAQATAAGLPPDYGRR
jgi:ABC-type transport system involved in cytochrome bd biosynthesis fused ATPase/permease subunit